MTALRERAKAWLRQAAIRFYVTLADRVTQRNLLPDHVTLGRHSYGVRRSTVLGATARAPVSLGNFCSVAAGVVMLAHVDHPTRLPSTFPFRTLLFRPPTEQPPAGDYNFDSVTRGPITIGHDVWIGQNAVILSGVTIGTGAVIGAGAVVARDVPPYGVVVGNPGRLVRSRFTPAIVERLLASRWWDLPDEALLRLEPRLYSPDIEAFLEAVEHERAACRR